jgi:hypothetical protein
MAIPAQILASSIWWIWQVLLVCCQGGNKIACRYWIKANLSNHLDTTQYLLIKRLTYYPWDESFCMYLGHEAIMET